MNREDIEKILEAVGFTDVTIIIGDKNGKH